MGWHTTLAQKAWFDTRARFLTGLVLLLLVAVTVVYSYDLMLAQLTFAQLEQQLLREGTFRDYRTYVWGAGVSDTIRQLTALFSVVIAAGGLLSQTSRGGGVFMLSLPVTRQQLLWTRTTVGLLELAVLTLLPMLFISGLSSAMGQRYLLIDAVAHALCLFVAGSVLFSGTTYLSTVFNDVWRPPLVALCTVVAMGFVLFLLSGSSRNSLLGVMTGETWLLDHRLPTIGLAASVAASAALLYLARRNLTRLDF